MSETEKVTRFEVRPPTERWVSRSGGSATDAFESDLIDHLAAQRSPRRHPCVKSFSSRANKTTIKPDVSDDARKMQSDYPQGGSFPLNLDPPALKRLADSGNTSAQYFYGMALLEGKDFPVDTQNGLKYLKKAADNRNSEAACKYSLTLMSNRKTAQDLEEAIKYLKLAAELGDPQGELEYGRLLILGKQIPKDPSRGYAFVKSAADQEYSPAQVKYAHVLMHGNQYIKKNVSNGVRYLKQAAKNKNLDAMVKLARLYEQGEVVNQNFRKAVDLFKEAAEMGNSDAENSYGVILLYGEYGCTARPEKALNILKRAASKNNPVALYNLYMCLSKSKNPSDKASSIEYLKKSAELGYDNAQYNMGIFFEKGEIFEKNLSEAARYYELASRRGNVKALCNFAAMLAAGEGVEKNEERALELFKKAADKGHTISQFRYAQMLEKKENPALYRSQITEYYTMAAKGGYSKAQFCAAKYLEIIDREKAKTFYASAGKNGIHEALYRLAILMQMDGEDYIPTMKEAAKKGIVEANVEVAIYEIKNGTEEEKKAALEIFRKASEEGNCDAKYQYGSALRLSNQREGLKLIKEAADEGNVLAQLEYGLELKENGRLSEAYRYINMSASAGNANAQYACATMLENGEGVPKSQHQAYEYIELAAKGGNPDAQFRYSEMLDSGINTLKSHSDSIRYLKHAADNGHIKASFVYSKVLLDQNSVQAIKYAARAAKAEKPNPEAVLVYAKLLKNGFGVPSDIPKAVEQFKRAAELGSRDAYFILGNMILDGEYDDTDKVAEDYLLKAADKGHTQAMKTLAEFYEEKKETQKSMHFYRLASDSGDNEARRKYGQMLLEDKSEKKQRVGDILIRNAAADNDIEAEFKVSCLPDVEKTKEGERMLTCSAMSGYPLALLKLAAKSAAPVRLLEKASSAGYAEALYSLGVIYSKQYPIRAPAFLTAAAEKGYSIAYLKLAEISNNEEEARYNLEKAYDAHVPGAEAKLGRIYEASNREKAVELYKSGSSKGEPEAMYRYSMVLLKEDAESQEGMALLIRAAAQNIPEAKMELADRLRAQGELGNALKFYSAVAKQTGDKRAIEAALEITKIIGKDNKSDDLHNLIKSKGKN